MPSNYYRSDGWVKTTQGPAVPGAQIYVCLQPANVTPPITPPRTLPVPWAGPNPQALIYSDEGLTPITQPIITDGFGHYDFYILPGLYTVVVMYNNVVQQVYVDQSVGNVGSSLGSSVLFSTNGTPNFNQLVQNLVQGTGVIISTDNLGNTTISGQATAPVLPTPTTARFSMWQATSTLNYNFYPINDSIAVGNVGVSTVNPPTALAGESVTMNQGGWHGEPFIWPTRDTTYSTLASLSELGNSTVYFGITNQRTDEGQIPTAGDFIGIVYYPTSSHWQLVTSTSGVVTTVDSGITIVPNQRYRLVVTVHAGVATLSVNGNNVVSTNILPTSNPLAISWYSNGTGPTQTLNTVEYMYATNATP
jgi:hypothetical protein